jgi:hypothetical protein
MGRVAAIERAEQRVPCAAGSGKGIGHLPGSFGARLRCQPADRDRRAERRFTVTSLFALTGVLLAYGYFGWALLTIAGAVTNAIWAYRIWRATTR